MRVRLPASPSGPPSKPVGLVADPRLPESAPPPAPLVGQPEAGPRFLDRATRPIVAWPILVLCGAALGWSLFIRLPESQRLLKVHARAGQFAETNRPIAREELSAMRQTARERGGTLVRERKDIPPLLSRLDAKARELGWRAEVSLKPAVSAPGGVRELTAHPVVVELRYEYVQPERAYAGLLAWLWAASTLQPRAELTALKLRSLGHGLNGAKVELTFFSPNPHEENSPK